MPFLFHIDFQVTDFPIAQHFLQVLRSSTQCSWMLGHGSLSLTVPLFFTYRILHSSFTRGQVSQGHPSGHHKLLLPTPPGTEAQNCACSITCTLPIFFLPPFPKFLYWGLTLTTYVGSQLYMLSSNVGHSPKIWSSGKTFRCSSLITNKYYTTALNNFALL